MTVAGVPGAFMLAGAMTLVQRHTSDASRGRFFGAFSAVEGIAIVSGTTAAGFLGHTLGIIPVLVAQGASYLIGGIAVVIALRREPDSKISGTKQASAPMTTTTSSADRR